MADVKNNSKTIITTLTPVKVQVKITKISKPEGAEGYRMMTCQDLETQKPFAISASDTFLKSFGYEKMFDCGLYTGGDKQPLYKEMFIVKVPADGNKYGYKAKDGSIIEYKGGEGCNVLADVGSDLAKESINIFENITANNNNNVAKAKAMFQALTGYPYLPTCSEDDRLLFMQCFK